MKKKQDDAPPAPMLWDEDPPVPFEGDENAEVVKLQPGQSVEGEIVDIIDSRRWPGRRIYKIQGEGDKVSVVLGTTMLDRLMIKKIVGDKVKIQRLADRPTDKGNPLQIYKTYSNGKGQKSGSSF